MSIEILETLENRVLRRREVRCLFRGMSGRLRRGDAVKAVSAELGSDPSLTKLISLKSSSGSRDVEALVYVYEREEDAIRQLPRYLTLRMLTKEERVKLRAEARKKRG